MKNFAFRKIFIILAEKLARLEVFYEEKKQIEDKANLQFLSACQKSLDGIKKEILKCKIPLIKTYEGVDLNTQELEDSLEIFKNCIEGFLELHTLLAHVPYNKVTPETYIFLGEVLKTRPNLSETDSRIVLLTQDFLTRNTHKCCTNLPFVPDLEKKPMALYLPILESTNPLYWPLLIKNVFANINKLKTFTREIYEEHINSKKEVSEEKRKLTEKMAFSLTSDLFAIKLLGPAYYYLFTELGVFRSIAETRIRNLPTICMREKVLFNELKKLNMADKLEQTHNWFVSLSKISEEMHSTLGFKEDLRELEDGINSMVEKIIKKSENILNDGGIYLQEDFSNSLIIAKHLESEDIKALDEMTSNTQQIINAGWICSEDKTEKLFYEILKEDDVSFKALYDYVKRTDKLLAKFIGFSRVQDIFLND